MPYKDEHKLGAGDEGDLALTVSVSCHGAFDDRQQAVLQPVHGVDVLHRDRQTSIVGFDNLELSMHSYPPLTTINVPAEEMGASAAECLLRTLNGELVSKHNPVGVELIVRESCGA